MFLLYTGIAFHFILEQNTFEGNSISFRAGLERFLLQFRAKRCLVSFGTNESTLRIKIISSLIKTETRRHRT